MAARCSECEGRTEAKKADYLIGGQSLGKFEAEVCSRCGETLFTEAAFEQIREAAKKKGLWSLSAKTKIRQIGGSLAITLNKKIADAMSLKKGDEVIAYPEGKKRMTIEAL